MRYLLDTHVFLWLVTAPERLSPPVRRKFESLGNELCVSAATVWEIAQKRALGKFSFEAEIGASMEKHALRELPIRGVHCETAALLPKHHKDPFDRLLVAQASVEGLVLVTRDGLLAQYGVPLLQV